MRPERKLINDKLWEFANRLDELNTNIKMYDILLKDLENPLKATSYDAVSTPDGTGSTTETAVILRERYCKSIEECTRAKEKCMKEFEEYISPLKLQAKLILRERYINGSNIRRTAIQLNYSEVRVKEIMAESQDFLYKKYIL